MRACSDLGVILYPAIDIRGGRAVRLEQGDYERETAFDDDPLDAAERWAAGGARALHVVDLDGARAGRPVNHEQVRRIVDATGLPVQAGGGIRDRAAAEALLEAGAERIVLGTVAHRDPELVAGLASDHGNAIAAGVDTRGGTVAITGWTEPTSTPATELVAGLAERGVRAFVFTPVEVDGTLGGPGIGELLALSAELERRGREGVELVYSGGVGSLDDLRELTESAPPAVAGVIVGRALYERRFTIAEALEALGGP